VTSEQQDDASIRTHSRWISFARRRPIIFIGAVIAAAVLLVIVLRQPPPASRQGGGRGGSNGPISVSTATAAVADVSIRIPALGTIAPLATVTVKTQISGQLQKVAFQEGQLVRQGDFLAQIDPRPYQAALAQAKANLNRDEALLANARLDQTRYQGLLAEDSIAQQTLDTQKALVQQYEGTVAGDRALVNTAALNLNYTHIVSPITGRVGLRQVDQGNYVTPGDANGIVVITQLQPISAIFSIPEDNVSVIMQRLHESVTLPVDAYDRSNSAKLATGRLATVDNEIDSSTGTFKLRALFDNQDGRLFANQFVNIQLLVNVLHDQIVIPNSAVHRGAPNGVVSTFVFVVNADSTVSVRSVTLGVIDGESVAVSEGLKAGDLVVTEGGDRLRDGARVLRPAGAATTPPSTSGAAQHGHGNHTHGAAGWKRAPKQGTAPGAPR
jgi:membrane fusion protein, multidrug efflux system